MNTEAEDMTDAWGQTWDADDRVGLGPAPTVKADDPRPALTERQAMLVAAIHGLTLANGTPPTNRELCVAFGFRSPNATAYHFVALVRKGYLREPRPLLSRDLVLIPPRSEAS